MIKNTNTLNQARNVKSLIINYKSTQTLKSNGQTLLLKGGTNMCAKDGFGGQTCLLTFLQRS